MIEDTRVFGEVILLPDKEICEFKLLKKNMALGISDVLHSKYIQREPVSGNIYKTGITSRMWRAVDFVSVIGNKLFLRGMPAAESDETVFDPKKVSFKISDDEFYMYMICPYYMTFHSLCTSALFSNTNLSAYDMLRIKKHRDFALHVLPYFTKWGTS